MEHSSSSLTLVVLISGTGSNLQALIDAQKTMQPPMMIQAVISNQSDAYGLERARQANIETHVISHRDFGTRELFDQALAACIDHYNPDVIVLAGFMRILTANFTQKYSGRLLNIHPSLLPKFPGLQTHERALAAGETEHGATVHFVTATLDAGPLIAQIRVPILADDDPQRLAKRVLAQEHRLYPHVMQWLAERRLQLGHDGYAWLDGQPMVVPYLVPTA
jgi:phosphoribosylglycinamide formyltransferase-1